MKINGIEIPDELLVEAGWTPPQKFEYPLYRMNEEGTVFEFTSRDTATVIVSGTDLGKPYVGSSYNGCAYHEDSCWTPCEKPKSEPKPLQFDGTPVWAYVSDDPDGYEDAVIDKRKLHVVAGDCNGLRAIRRGKSNTESTDACYWRYAWEIPEDEA